VEDVQNIYVRKNDRIYQLKDLAQVELAPEKETGMAIYNGKRAIVLSVIKQSEEDISKMRKAIPIRIGYSQSLFGFNSFKWGKKIEPLKYQKAKTQFLYSQEEISETAIQYFFSLAIAQLEYDMAADNVASSDTLYRFGEERHKIASISQADLLTLKLDAVNARNSLKNASSNLKRAMFNFVSFLNLDKQTEVKLELPDRPAVPEIAPESALEYARKNNPSFLADKQELLEAERDVDRTKKMSRFDASFSASIGFNQAAYNLPDVCRKIWAIGRACIIKPWALLFIRTISNPGRIGLWAARCACLPRK